MLSHFCWKTTYDLFELCNYSNVVYCTDYYRIQSFKDRNDFETPWFIGEACMTVGMVGTVIIFMLMLGSSFAEIDPSNIESMKRVITDMVIGMSTALLTTLWFDCKFIC